MFKFAKDNPNLRNIFVKLFMTDNCIALRTCDRLHGSRGRFLINRERFSAWLKDLPEIEDEALEEIAVILHGGNFFDTDCGHFMSAWRDRENIRFCVTWLSSYGKEEVKGFTQAFCVPVANLCALLDENVSIRLVYAENGGSARISCNSYAVKTVRRIHGDKLKRHAFRKAMRDCFQWKGDVVTLYADGRNDFYFDADGAWRINGGLILHDSKIETAHGVYPEFYYSVHT